MTISFAGKGGVGKTTTCSLISLYLDKKGFKVLAIDADPDSNLATSLGAKECTPLSQNKELLSSIVQNTKSGLNGFYELNVSVENVVEEYGESWGTNGDIMTLGWTKNGGEGCYCVENTALSSMIKSVDKNKYDFIIIDGEAGLEHLSRGVFSNSDLLVLVYQMGKRSIQTAKDAKKLARDLGIKNIKNSICGYKDNELDLFKDIFKEDFSLKIPSLNSIREKDILGKKLVLEEEIEKELDVFFNEIKVIKDDESKRS